MGKKMTLKKFICVIYIFGWNSIKIVVFKTRVYLHTQRKARWIFTLFDLKQLVCSTCLPCINSSALDHIMVCSCQQFSQSGVSDVCILDHQFLHGSRKTGRNTNYYYKEILLYYKESSLT